MFWNSWRAEKLGINFGEILFTENFSSWIKYFSLFEDFSFPILYFQAQLFKDSSDSWQRKAIVSKLPECEKNYTSSRAGKWKFLSVYIKMVRDTLYNSLNHQITLTHFTLMLYFYTPWKRQETSDFKLFFSVLEMFWK